VTGEPFPLGHMGDPFGEIHEVDESTTKTGNPLVNENDIGDAIAELAPDVSWADDLRTPTPAEIRERVRNFTPEQRAAVERDAVRAEFGDPT
jgi:hypothetical protein